ncbi:MAG TPA: hypothetical protein VFO39_18730 [Candidatus Sulfotelmatobacter sp.]|nr:hypothetical protein [Candidatus Sulfotelmatobacter sp.]
MTLRNLVSGKFVHAAIVVTIVVMTACSSEPSKPAESKPEAPKGPELLTGRAAFQKVFIAARGWARDAQPYRLESAIMADGNGHDGKAALWRATFASPTQRAVKGYQWSGSAAADAPSRGINPGTEDSYSPTNSSTQIFDIAFLKVDSDQAFSTAQKHGGDKLLEKTPDTPVLYICDWNRSSNQLLWHVIYGTNRDSAQLKIAIDASTGEFLRVEK